MVRTKEVLCFDSRGSMLSASPPKIPPGMKYSKRRSQSARILDNARLMSLVVAGHMDFYHLMATTRVPLGT
jgi:hypothetical protein